MHRFFPLAALLATAAAPAPTSILLHPAAVFDGEALHAGWSVLVTGDEIAAVGPAVSAPAGAETIELPGDTLIPGLIDAHVHLFLHPYNETNWNDQVLHEPLALRTARAVAAARATLAAGFTTVRDLGTEGAGNADQGLKLAIEGGIVPGPRLLSSNRAIVATGSYGPRGYAFDVPQGAEEASGDGVTQAARHQMGEGAEVVKLYADYHYYGNAAPWQKLAVTAGGSTPTFTIAEMAGAVGAAHDAGRRVAAP
uniref:amidohydrolase family protein n=1 Tax=Sphingomonas bacterium TaxID=1895847 RepID=UPI0015769B82